jgi:hypothetical protein
MLWSVTLSHVTVSFSLAPKVNPDGFIKGKKTVFPGVGADRLRLLQARAALLKAPLPKPYLREPVILDVFPLELFFDVEVDPLRGICYLHGFVERLFKRSSKSGAQGRDHCRTAHRANPAPSF